MDIVECLAKAEYTARRLGILLRIAKGECSASMSGIEYMPYEWEKADQFSKEPFLARAKQAASEITRLREENKVMREDLGVDTDSPLA